MTQILALRSYGDFVVLMHAIKHSKSTHNINIVISLHLKPLFDALNWTNMNECIHIEFIDFGIKKGLLSFFTNKYLFTKSSFEELITIKQFLKKRNIELNEQLYLERENRISFLQLFLGKKLLSIHQKGNVYDCVQEFFQCSETNNLVEYSFEKILVFPDSRKQKKIIPDSILSKIATFCNSKQIELQIACFGTAISPNSNVIYYNDFITLIDLVKKAEFIISSDSVTAHLAQYFNKLHFIIYPDKVNEEWLTPWASLMGMYTTFDQSHILFSKIDKI